MAHVPAERCLGILELLADGAREMPLGEIAERLAVPKSGAHRLLSTLVDLGWAEQERSTGFYRLTMRLAVLGQRFYTRRACRTSASRCSTASRKTAANSRGSRSSTAARWCGSLMRKGAVGGLVYQPTQTTEPVPLFATASGKAWLATLREPDALQHVASHGGFRDADRYGPNVIRSANKLVQELRLTARRGFGVAHNEAEPGVTAIAAAIRTGTDNGAVGTVSIAGPTARMTESRVRELAPRVVQCASELSSLWPVRPSRRAKPPASDVDRAA
jgi:DNA-binding IclR family transcriptional regulator